MLSLDLSPEVDFSMALESIRCWSLALTVKQQAELQQKIREGISADAQVTLRATFREQNAHVIVDQFLRLIKLPELNSFLQNEEHIVLITNKMREVLECNPSLFLQKILQRTDINANFLAKIK